MHVAAAQGLRIHLLAGRRLYEGRPREKYRALVPHDDGLIAHGRHVGAACRAAAHDERHLRDAACRQLRLIEEDAPEVIPVGKHLILQGQESTARVHEVHTRKRMLERDRLRAQMLLHGERKVSAALEGCIVGNDDAGAPMDAADAADESRAGASAPYMPWAA